MTTQTITEFLTARLDEDEAAAREAIEERRRVQPERGDEPDYDLAAFVDIGTPAVVVGPERVLREVAAKRRVLERHHWAEPPYKNGKYLCWGCGFGENYGDDPTTPDVNDCPELRDLAAVYSDHPNYREEWKP